MPFSQGSSQPRDITLYVTGNVWITNTKDFLVNIKAILMSFSMKNCKGKCGKDDEVRRPKFISSIKNYTHLQSNYWWEWAKTNRKYFPQLKIQKLNHKEGYPGGPVLRRWALRIKSTRAILENTRTVENRDFTLKGHILNLTCSGTQQRAVVWKDPGSDPLTDLEAYPGDTGGKGEDSSIHLEMKKEKL